MKNAANSFREAKMVADDLCKKFKSPFGVIFDPYFDGIHNWRISLGKPKYAEYISGK